jgi:hypothetical protein
MKPPVQGHEVLLQILPVGLPGHPVHPRSGLGAQCPVGHPEAVEVDMVQQRREPRVPVPSCRVAHTVQLTRRALPGSGSGARVAGRVPLGQPPFLHRLRSRSHGVVRRLHRYYGAVRLPTVVHLRLGASAFPERPAR